MLLFFLSFWINVKFGIAISASLTFSSDKCVFIITIILYFLLINFSFTNLFLTELAFVCNIFKLYLFFFTRMIF